MSQVVSQTLSLICTVVHLLLDTRFHLSTWCFLGRTACQNQTRQGNIVVKVEAYDNCDMDVLEGTAKVAQPPTAYIFTG